MRKSAIFAFAPVAAAVVVAGCGGAGAAGSVWYALTRNGTEVTHG
jgi:hypothetical protein